MSVWHVKRNKLPLHSPAALIDAKANMSPEYQHALVAQCVCSILYQENALEMTPAVSADYNNDVSLQASFVDDSVEAYDQTDGAHGVQSASHKHRRQSVSLRRCCGIHKIKNRIVSPL